MVSTYPKPQDIAYSLPLSAQYLLNGLTKCKIILDSSKLFH